MEYALWISQHAIGHSLSFTRFTSTNIPIPFVVDYTSLAQLWLWSFWLPRSQLNSGGSLLWVLPKAICSPGVGTSSLSAINLQPFSMSGLAFSVTGVCGGKFWRVKYRFNETESVQTEDSPGERNRGNNTMLEWVVYQYCKSDDGVQGGTPAWGVPLHPLVPNSMNIAIPLMLTFKWGQQCGSKGDLVVCPHLANSDWIRFWMFLMEYQFVPKPTKSSMSSGKLGLH